MPSFWQRVSSMLGERRLLGLMRFYPPYFGAGVRVTHASEGLRTIEVEMPLTPLNRNYVGTQFGGSLYSMTDPFFMLMLMLRLGGEYVVWDKHASIDFLKPGRGTVRARFELHDERVEEIRRQVSELGKIEPIFEVDIVDREGTVVARVKKVLYVRRKDARRREAA